MINHLIAYPVTLQPPGCMPSDQPPTEHMKQTMIIIRNDTGINVLDAAHVQSMQFTGVPKKHAGPGTVPRSIFVGLNNGMVFRAEDQTGYDLLSKLVELGRITEKDFDIVTKDYMGRAGKADIPKAPEESDEQLVARLRKQLEELYVHADRLDSRIKQAEKQTTRVGGIEVAPVVADLAAEIAGEQQAVTS